jgi:hypothetical protein
VFPADAASHQQDYQEISDERTAMMVVAEGVAADLRVALG